MRKRLFLLIVAAASILLASACATFDRPFASPEDAARTRRITDKLREYPDVRITAVGDRVYLEGWVLDFAERQAVLSTVRSVPGVAQIMDNMMLSEPGSLGDGYDWQ